MCPGEEVHAFYSIPLLPIMCPGEEVHAFYSIPLLPIMCPGEEVHAFYSIPLSPIMCPGEEVRAFYSIPLPGNRFYRFQRCHIGMTKFYISRSYIFANDVPRGNVCSRKVLHVKDSVKTCFRLIERHHVIK